MAWDIAGVLEGFYGPPWSWDDRIEVARWCAARGMRHYVWAPKDDALHRSGWRDPWSAANLDGFSRLVGQGGLEVGLGMSPGLSIDYRSTDDREALWAKVAPVLEVGARLVVLALDDIPNRPGLGDDHAAITAWLAGRLGGAARLVLVPTEYVGAAASPYLDALVAGVPEEVSIAWTGDSVVNDTVTSPEAVARASAVGGRPPLLWDNVPVNDAVMADRLFLGPLQGRDPDLGRHCSGYLANAMVQSRASTLPLASIAAYLRDDDPVVAWEAEADRLGWRLLADACDGTVLGRMVDALDTEVGQPAWPLPVDRLRVWLTDATTCRAPGLEEQAAPWLAQVRGEADVGLAALRLYAATKPLLEVGADGRGRALAPSPDRVLAASFEVMLRWPPVRRTAVSVLGVRCGFRPMIRAMPGGSWAVRGDALSEDGNALDHLVRLSLAEAAGIGPSTPVTVQADGVVVDVAADGTFTAPPGATVLATAGGAATCSYPVS